jgi:hypothetical protein
MGEDQHGSRSGRGATDACREKLTYDISRLIRTSVITVDKDAKGCYDRIRQILAMIACMSMGLPRLAAKMHNLTHSGMKHTARTLHGISTAFYTASPDEELEAPAKTVGPLASGPSTALP